MYAQYFGLSRSPFELTPDPAFLSPMPRHTEALARLWYGVRQRKGFVVVTGEVGTGKTLLLRCLLEALAREGMQFSYIFNPRLTASEFLQDAVTDFGLATAGQAKPEILRKLNCWLLGTHNRGSIAVLVVDEAHLLDWDVLEEIRLLTNLETTEHKLLQIVLAGQTELEEKLKSSQLRQLRQRIAFHAKLLALTEAETVSYIQQRLAKAGAGVQTILPESVCRLVHEYSQGIPRVINNLCENAMLCAFAKRVHVVNAAIVHQVAQDQGLTALAASTGADPRSTVMPEAIEKDVRHRRTGVGGFFANFRRKV